MTDIIATSFSEDTDFGDFTEELIEDFQTELFTEAWSQINIEELNKSLDMAMGNTNRFDVESPDSGIDMNNFDFDIEGCNALIGVNDPILTNLECGESENQNNPSDEVISLELPVITSDSFEECNDLTSAMESEEEEDQENESSNIPKNHPVEIHSYSVLKIKKTQALKSKSQFSLIKDRLTNARKYSISVNKKQKLYEMEPLKDPMAERKRLDALNAKKNRDRKKQQLQEAEEEIDRLKDENEELKSEADQVKDELAAAKRELDALRQELKLRGSENASFLDEREE
eukprot:GFUD01067106.1.p1 GENE.GFUD01067106.1~~GFUD01067106.1.p1  ORF type:complete len:287 (-),score=76.17 GFUD01067106.1:307-1167(-)